MVAIGEKMRICVYVLKIYLIFVPIIVYYRYYAEK